jgi:hypothetical protein
VLRTYFLIAPTVLFLIAVLKIFFREEVFRRLSTANKLSLLLTTMDDEDLEQFALLAVKKLGRINKQQRQDLITVGLSRTC